MFLNSKQEPKFQTLWLMKKKTYLFAKRVNGSVGADYLEFRYCLESSAWNFGFETMNLHKFFTLYLLFVL